MSKLEQYKNLGIKTLLVSVNMQNIFEELEKDSQILKFNGLRNIIGYYFGVFEEDIDFNKMVNESLPEILSKSEEEFEDIIGFTYLDECVARFYYYLDDNSCEEFDVYNDDYEWIPEKDFTPDANTLVIDLSTFLSIVKDN